MNDKRNKINPSSWTVSKCTEVLSSHTQVISMGGSAGEIRTLQKVPTTPGVVTDAEKLIGIVVEGKTFKIGPQRKFYATQFGR